MEKAADRGRKAARQAVASGLGLCAMALVTGNLGNLSRVLNGTLAVVALLGLAVLLLRRPARSELPRAVPGLVLIVLSLPIAARGEPWGLWGAALVFLGISLSAEADRGLAGALLLTALLFAFYRLLVAYVPTAWYIEHWLAVYFSWFVGVGLMLGPTALGLPILVLFALFGLSVWLLAGRRATAVFSLWLVALVLAAIAYLWLQPPLGSWLLEHWPAAPGALRLTPSLPTLTYLESPLLLFLLLWLVSALAGLWLRPQPLPPVPARRAGPWAMAGLSLLALGTIALTLDPPQQARRGPILIYDAGHLEWGRPFFGQYGAHSSGAFGLVPDYLAAYGYPVRIGPLTTENLDGARAVVLINLPEKLPVAEKERLLTFVEAGGGLVIWGEHTGLGRIREPTNDLLAALPGRPISLNFDSAVPIRQGWAEGLTLLPHPAVYGVRDPVDLVIAVGASLDVRPPARPLIVGRFGHSDTGDATNQARNYVGDMRYNPGERLGDVVLAAGVPYGAGQIVVLGDTTPLGSVNLMTTMPFHARLLDWLTARRPWLWSQILRQGWLAALLLLGAATCLVRARSHGVLAGAVVVSGLALFVATRLDAAWSAPAQPGGPIAYVDVSHQERLDRLLWEDTSIGGLDYNLARNGYLPLLLRDLDPAALARAELLVVVAPGQPFSRAEVQAITRWVEAGGHLLVSTGYEESAASEPLLAAFGLQVDNVPLGPAEVQRAGHVVLFHEAWPVVAAAPYARPIASAYGRPLIVYQPWGQGGVVLIGDSEFLLGSTLEGETQYNEGNILLLRDALRIYLDLGAPYAGLSSTASDTAGGEP